MPATRKGFTLIELMIVITIIALLTTVGIVAYTNAQVYARDSRRKNDLKSIQTALELYYQKNGSYFSSTSPIYSTDGTWSNILGGASSFTTYINTMPIDPKNTSTLKYGYASTTSSTYYLCTSLENTKDSSINVAVDGNGVPTSTCLNDSSNTIFGNYQLKNP